MQADWSLSVVHMECVSKLSEMCEQAELPEHLTVVYAVHLQGHVLTLNKLMSKNMRACCRAAKHG